METSLRTVDIVVSVLGYGGTEVQTLHLAKALRRIGFGVRIVCLFEAESAVVASFGELGISVTCCGWERSMPLGRVIRKMARMWRRMGPAAVHVQYVERGAACLLAATLAGVRHRFATVHQVADAYGHGPKLLLRLAMRLTDAVFFVSKTAERSWLGQDACLFERQAPSRKHYTIYNCVEIDEIARLAREGATQARVQYGIESRRIILCVGRLSKEKGQQLVLAALPLIRAQVDDVVAVFAGDGPLLETLREEAERLSVTGAVLFTGAVARKQVFALYGAADVVVVPSLQEGFGLVAAEGMAASRPVVASATGGLTEVIEDGVTGSLAPPGDAPALGTQILRYLTDMTHAASTGSNGRRRAQSMFSLDRYQRIIQDVYATVV